MEDNSWADQVITCNDDGGLWEVVPRYIVKDRFAQGVPGPTSTACLRMYYVAEGKEEGQSEKS
jgi:hypothetical protein